MIRLSSDTIAAVVLAALLGIISYFFMETCTSLKSLEKDMITIREKITAIEATRITRKDIAEMIADYHSTHPCTASRQ